MDEKDVRLTGVERGVIAEALWVLMLEWNKRGRETTMISDLREKILVIGPTS